MAGEVAMRFVSDAAQLLADYDKMKAKEEGLQKATNDTAKAIARRRKEQQAMAREAVKLEKQTLTPLEKYKKRLLEIEQLRKRGLISEETHRRAATLAWKDSGLAAIQAEKALKKEEAERAKVIAVEKRQSESARRRARYEEALGRKQKQVLREIATPQERHNARIKELNRLRQQGKLAENEYGRAVKMSQEKLEEQLRSKEKAVDTGGLASMVHSWLGVAGAVAMATAAIHEYAAAKEAAAQKAIESRRGMGSLAQVATSEKHYKQLQSKARDLYLSGAVDSEDEGARAVFAIESAGDMGDFELYKNMGEAKLVANLDVMGKSSKTLKASMGEGETGGTRAIMSKAFAASAYSPASAEQLLEAAARSGGSAKALGFSDEEVLASTAIMATTTGGASEGGTTMASLLRSLDEKQEEIKTADGKKPKTLKDALAIVKAKDLKGEELKKFFGRSEAVRAYRDLTANADTYASALQDIRRAEKGDLVGVKLGLHETDPGLVAAKKREQAQAALEESMRPAGTARNFSEAYILEEAAADRAGGMYEAEVFLRDKMRRFKRATAIPGAQGQDVGFLEGEAATNPRAVAYLEEAAKALAQAADKIGQAADKQTTAADKQARPANPAVSHGDHQ